MLGGWGRCCPDPRIGVIMSWPQKQAGPEVHALSKLSNQPAQVPAHASMQLCPAFQPIPTHSSLHTLPYTPVMPGAPYVNWHVPPAARTTMSATSPSTFTNSAPALGRELQKGEPSVVVVAGGVEGGAEGGAAAGGGVAGRKSS